jgi:hypothetical protein
MRNGLIAETEVALQKIASLVETFIPQFVSLQPDGSGSPKMMALREAMSAFPLPADVLYIDNSLHASLDEGPGALTLLRFDMTQPKTLQVNFIDEVNSADLPSSESALSMHFGAFPEAVQLICDLHLGSMWHDDKFTFLVPCDIRTHPEECARELVMHVFMGNSPFSERFLHVTNFNVKYNLQADQILSDDELLGWDPAFEAYQDCSYQGTSLRQRQEQMATIQLIPQVPESVREVVRRAKRLYIFGHFEYSFFTIACHYAYAAVESAIFNRWNVDLPERLNLEHATNATLHESAVIPRAGWKGIQAYCLNRRWSIHKLRINGTSFPTSAAKVIDRLREDGLINDWQNWRLRKVYLGLRNSHSHLEFCSTDLPGASTIERAVAEINMLFDSVPVGGY